MTSNGELACTYALLILNDEAIPVTAEKISQLLKSAKVSSESYWPTLFAKLAERKSIDDLLLNATTSGATASATNDATSTDSVLAVEEDKKEEAKDVVEEEEDDNIFSLFDE